MQGDLNGRVYRGWRESLDRIAKKPFDPVFGPWFAFQQLTTERFADDAALLSAHYVDQTSGEPSRQPPASPRRWPPSRPRASRKLPPSMARCSAKPTSAWRQSLTAADQAHAPLPTRLPDDAPKNCG